MSVVNQVVAAAVAEIERPPGIVARIAAAMEATLNETLPNRVHVDRFPARPTQYDMAGRDAVVLVAYQGSKFPDPATPDAVIQLREMTFDVVILVRALDGMDESYWVLDAVYEAIGGKSFAGARPAYASSEKLEDEHEGIWRWVLAFTVGAPAPSLPPRPDGPLASFTRR